MKTFWDWFDDEWLVTRHAARLFVASTLFVLALTPAFAGWISGADISVGERVFWGLLGSLGSIATIFLWLGMWRFWVYVDKSSRTARKIWFVVLLLGFWWGSCVYFYLVYVPQVVRMKRASRT